MLIGDVGYALVVFLRHWCGIEETDQKGSDSEGLGEERKARKVFSIEEMIEKQKQISQARGYTSQAIEHIYKVINCFYMIFR